MSLVGKLDPEQSIRRQARTGLLALVVLVFGVGGWSAVASIHGAIIASGTVVVEGSTKRVQHAEGGIVHAIHVADGDHVEAGDVLIELDGTRLRAEQQIIKGRRFDNEVKQLRLLAEVNGLDRLALSDELAAEAAARPDFAAMLEVQQNLLEARLANRRSQADQLGEQVRRLQSELLGLEQEHEARESELALIRDELAAIEKLASKGLALRQGLNNLRRQEANTSAELGRLTTDMASSRGRIKELRIKLADLESQFASETLKQLEETSSVLSDLGAQEIALQDRLHRLSIRAPKSGLVHELSVHTINAVIGAGDTLLSIVPVSETLIIETHVQPLDIDQVQIGQKAQVRLSAFNMRTTPTLAASVRTVSADQSVDPMTGEPFYNVRLALDDGEAGRIGGARITPGMPVEVLVTSNERTVLGYLMQPLTDQISHAFREQ